MEFLRYDGIDLAKVLPQIPESLRNDLPFGLIRLDVNGTIIEYNTAEGQLTGVDPKWAIGKNFFDEVAPCTKTDRFYGKFVEGVTKRFLNAVIDYTFDHLNTAIKVKVHMISMPNHLGKIEIALMIARTRQPLVSDAFAGGVSPVSVAVPMQEFRPRPAPPAAVSSTSGSSIQSPSVNEIVKAVMTAMNQPPT